MRFLPFSFKKPQEYVSLNNDINDNNYDDNDNNNNIDNNNIDNNNDDANNNSIVTLPVLLTTC